MMDGIFAGDLIGPLHGIVPRIQPGDRNRKRRRSDGGDGEKEERREPDPDGDDHLIDKKA